MSEPERLRHLARVAVGAGIALLIVASLGTFSKWWPVYIAALAALTNMVSTGVLIANSTQTTADTGVQYQQVAGNGTTNTTGGGPSDNLDFKTCIQGYSILPVAITSVLSLAMYKAAADVAGMGPKDTPHPQQLFAVAVLRFVGCGSLLRAGGHGADPMRSSSNASSVKLLDDGSASPDPEVIAAFQAKFLWGVVWAVVLYLVIYALRAVFTAKFPSGEADAEEKRVCRQAARAAFGAAVVILVFAAVGFFPLVLATASSGISILASAWMYVQDSSPRMMVQTHAFMTVTLTCFFCLGALLFETKAMDEHTDESRVLVHLVGFQQAFFCACWFACITAIRDIYKAMPARS